MTHPLEEETAREIAVKVIPDTVIYVADLRLKAEPVILAALRSARNEATRAEKEAIALMFERGPFVPDASAAAAIRARITP